ncbi:hypothetical protein M426DRAFT_69064 [Hypoxylon sp. CI-4A]|nr:hypothetical protein M426DRAFT_69064 [Hypoxylon sp. CI-4A]
MPTSDNGYCSILGLAIRNLRCRNGTEHQDLELVKKILGAGGDANSFTSSYPAQSALLDAIETGNIRVVELLLHHGANVNEPARFRLRRTPLQKAVEIGSLEIIHLLLEKGADINEAPAMRGGATVLQLAAINGNYSIAMELIKRGARFDAPLSPYGGGGRWPLEGAAENGRLDMIQLIWNMKHGQLGIEQCRKAMRLAEYNGHFGCRDLIAKLMPSAMAIDEENHGSSTIEPHASFDI